MLLLNINRKAYISLMTLSHCILSDTEMSNSRSLRFQSLISCRGAELGHKLLWCYSPPRHGGVAKFLSSWCNLRGATLIYSSTLTFTSCFITGFITGGSWWWSTFGGQAKLSLRHIWSIDDSGTPSPSIIWPIISYFHRFTIARLSPFNRHVIKHDARYERREMRYDPKIEQKMVKCESWTEKTKLDVLHMHMSKGSSRQFPNGKT